MQKKILEACTALGPLGRGRPGSGESILSEARGRRNRKRNCGGKGY